MVRGNGHTRKPVGWPSAVVVEMFVVMSRLFGEKEQNEKKKQHVDTFETGELASYVMVLL